MALETTRINPAFGYVARRQPDGSVVPEWVSESINHLLGYGADADLASWEQHIHPDDFGIALESIETLTRGEAWSGELRMLTVSGETRWVHFYSEAELLPDGSVRIEGWGHDVTDTKRLMTELQQMEERLRLLEDHVMAITWTTDVDGRFTTTGGSGLSLLGVGPDDAIGMTVADYFQTDDPEFLPIAATRRSLEGEVVRLELELNGTRFRAVTEPMRDAEESIIGTLGVAVAIGHEDRSADRLTTLNRELHEMRLAATGASATNEVIKVADLTVNAAAFAAWKGDKRLRLSPTEFRLLMVLLKNRNRALSRGRLLNEVWHHDFMGESRLVDMAINRLRHKIEDDHTHPTLIRTVRGVGYRFDDDTTTGPMSVS